MSVGAENYEYNRNVRKFRLHALLSCLILSTTPGYGASFSVEFAGTIGNCGGACNGILGDLVGTGFSGQFVFPDTGIDLRPADPLLGIYSFGTGAGYFNFDSEIDEFDEISTSPIQVQVRDCDPVLGCSLVNSDVVWISHDNGTFRYDLSLNLYPSGDHAFSGDAIPSLLVLQALADDPAPYTAPQLGFSIFTSDWDDGVDTYSIVPPGSLTVTVSAIPLPATVWLFGAALGLLGSIIRRKQ